MRRETKVRRQRSAEAWRLPARAAVPSRFRDARARQFHSPGPLLERAPTPRDLRRYWEYEPIHSARECVAPTPGPRAGAQLWKAWLERHPLAAVPFEDWQRFLQGGRDSCPRARGGGEGSGNLVGAEPGKKRHLWGRVRQRAQRNGPPAGSPILCSSVQPCVSPMAQARSSSARVVRGPRGERLPD